jgi:membrane-bound metal-dependent hydrolase YbcI (DUF457 family)
MVAVTAGSILAPPRLLKPFLIIGTACAVVPDVDAIGRLFYGAGGDVAALGGHRGFTHSVTFAALLGLVISFVALIDQRFEGHRLRLGIFVAIATGFHGVLDVFTSIGATTSPVQFLNPFSTRGYGISAHPINGPFSEFFLCFLPLLGVTRGVWHVRGIPWPRWPSAGTGGLGLDRIAAPPNGPRQPASSVGATSSGDTTGGAARG